MSTSLNLVVSAELERSQAAIKAALRMPLPKDVRTKLRLQQRRNRIAIEASDAVCAHPVAMLRYDGLYDADVHGEVMASVTCTAAGCGSSFSVPVRSDVANGHGGPRIDSVMLHDTPRAPLDVIPDGIESGSDSSHLRAGV